MLCLKKYFEIKAKFIIFIGHSDFNMFIKRDILVIFSRHLLRKYGYFTTRHSNYTINAGKRI